MKALVKILPPLPMPEQQCRRQNHRYLFWIFGPHAAERVGSIGSVTLRNPPLATISSGPRIRYTHFYLLTPPTVISPPSPSEYCHGVPHPTSAVRRHPRRPCRTGAGARERGAGTVRGIYTTEPSLDSHVRFDDGRHS